MRWKPTLFLTHVLTQNYQKMLKRYRADTRESLPNAPLIEPILVQILRAVCSWYLVLNPMVESCVLTATIVNTFYGKSILSSYVSYNH